MTEFDAIKSLPYFSHLNFVEVDLLLKQSISIHVEPGKDFLADKESLYVMLDGFSSLYSVFSEDPGMTIAPGSFFGSLPFLENDKKIRIKSLTGSSFLRIPLISIYRLIALNYKAGRGFFRAVDELKGISHKEQSSGSSKNTSVIISVTSVGRGSGKTLMSSILAVSLEARGKVLILDLSFNGKTAASLFCFSPKPAVSQKNEAESEDLLGKSVSAVSQNIDYLNVTNGSLICPNPEIIKVIIARFSKDYQYILMDIEDFNNYTMGMGIGISDFVFFLIKNPADFKKIYSLIDNYANDGQRICYVPNKLFLPRMKANYDNISLEKLDTSTGLSYQYLKNLCDNGIFEKIVNYICDKKETLVLNSGIHEAPMFSFLFKDLYKNRQKFGLIASSGIPFIISSLFSIIEDEDDFIKNVDELFKSERINYLLDIKFPDESIIKLGKIKSYFKYLVGKKRLENQSIKIMGLFNDGENRSRLFTAGNFAGLMSASFSVFPLVESCQTSGGTLHSGYPYNYFNSSVLRRYNVGKITSIFLKNSSAVLEKKLLKIYDNYVDFLLPDFFSLASKDRNIVIDMDTNDVSMNGNVESSNPFLNVIKG